MYADEELAGKQRAVEFTVTLAGAQSPGSFGAIWEGNAQLLEDGRVMPS